MKQSDLTRKMESYAFLTHSPDGEEMWVVPLVTVKKGLRKLEVRNKNLQLEIDMLKACADIGIAENEALRTGHFKQLAETDYCYMCEEHGHSHAKDCLLTRAASRNTQEVE